MLNGWSEAITHYMFGIKLQAINKDTFLKSDIAMNHTY